MAKKTSATKTRLGATRSQPARQPSADNSTSNSKPTAEPAPKKPAPAAGIEVRVRDLYRQLADELHKASPAAHSKESDLHIALARFLADDKLNRVISQLEEIARECPGTVEGSKADAAIQALKAGSACSSSSPSASLPSAEKPLADDA